MRFLADESCDFSVVRASRSNGHDVRAIREDLPGADDIDIAELAVREDRVLLTEDKDFGQIAFSSSRRSSGVILIRFPGNRRSELASTVVNLVARVGIELKERFAVIQPGRVRISEKL